MHDTIRHPEDLLLQVVPGAACRICASEAIPNHPTDDPMVRLQEPDWHQWPWEPCQREVTWLVSGQVEHEEGDYLVLCSGSDYFLLRRPDLLLVAHGPKALVPAGITESR
jgi:hypothetical protein